MSDLSFENNRESQNSRYTNMYTSSRKMPVLQRLLISSGLAKDETKADKILVVISIVLIVFAVVYFIFKSRPPSVKVIHLQPRPIVEKQASSSQSQGVQSPRSR